jgi:dTDP-4-dehydrorhamnose reductase
MALLARGRAGEVMKVPSDQWGSPTYGANLSAAVRELAGGSARGILHVVGPDYLDRVSFARLACDTLGISDDFLRPMTTADLGQRALRPLRGGLDASRARKLLSTPLLDARQGLQRMCDRLRAEGVL